MHSERYQVIVTKKELMWQFLIAYSDQSNLLKLLSCSGEEDDYQKLLLLTSIKMEAIGSFNYVGKNRTLKKLPPKVYERMLFDDFVESKDDVAFILKIDNDEILERIFRKYQAVKYYIVPMLSVVNEQWYVSEYMSLLDFVVKNNVYPKTNFNEYGFPEELVYLIKNVSILENDYHS